MTTEEQRQSGEIGVYRALLSKSAQMVEAMLLEDMPHYEATLLVEFLTQINEALHGAPADLLTA